MEIAHGVPTCLASARTTDATSRCVFTRPLKHPVLTPPVFPLRGSGRAPVTDSLESIVDGGLQNRGIVQVVQTDGPP